jgi:hypothetical protein
MRPTLAGLLALLLVLPALWARDDKDKEKPKDKPATPAAQLKALQDELSKQFEEFRKAYADAKTPEEKTKVLSEKRPKPEAFAGRFLELAQKNSKDPVAVDALIWVATMTREGKEYDKALDILGKEYVEDARMTQVAQRLSFSDSPAAAKFLRTLLAKNKNQETQTWAAFALGSYLKNQAENFKTSPETAAKELKEAVPFLERVEKDGGEIKYGRETLSVQAKDTLYEIRHLSLGMKTPEIEGEDLDAKKFKLSDYKGKVVLLDFWGNW